MTSGWINPDRIESHTLLRLEETLTPLATGTTARAMMPARSVEYVFYRGLIPDVVNAPWDVINTRLDVVVDRLIAATDGNGELAQWEEFSANANLRRRTAQPFLGLSLQDARSMLATSCGRYLIQPLPFEDSARRNNTYELLYFRDSGLHRRLVERRSVKHSVTFSSRDAAKAEKLGVSLEDIRLTRLADYQPKRWEAFVVVSILDLVGARCEAFAYRNNETAEIDLILEWRDRSPTERWAIEVASRKFNRHPSDHFSGSCDHLGVAHANRFVVFRANECNGTERARGGVRACALPRILDSLSKRLAT